MNSNELRDYVRDLNKKEQVEIEQRRQAAMKRIQALREELKYKRSTETSTSE